MQRASHIAHVELLAPCFLCTIQWCGAQRADEQVVESSGEGWLATKQTDGRNSAKDDTREGRRGREEGTLGNLCSEVSCCETSSCLPFFSFLFVLWIGDLAEWKIKWLSFCFQESYCALRTVYTHSEITNKGCFIQKKIAVPNQMHLAGNRTTATTDWRNNTKRATSRQEWPFTF